jgi:hypothetical protein
VILASADVGSDKAGVDDSREATQIAGVDHAATLTAEALPPKKHGSVSTSAIRRPSLPGGSYTVQQREDAHEAVLRSVSAGSAQGETHMHTGEHQRHTGSARTALWLEGGR